MSKHHFRRPYPDEFKQQLVELVRAGRTVAELAREFEPSRETISKWVKEADGHRPAESSSADRAEVTRLRKELKQVRLERDILAKAAAWFARETALSGSTDS